jgi:ABC-type transporter Mla subunit MlaD
MSDSLDSGSTTSEQSTFDSGSHATESIRRQAAETTQAAKEQLSAAAQPLADKARDIAEEQRKTGAERIEGVAQAVHGAADDISEHVPQLSGYIHSGAEQLQRASRVLRENSVDDLLQMTKRLAHDRPLAFIGGSVAAGFALARFLKSSGSESGSMRS